MQTQDQCGALWVSIKGFGVVDVVLPTGVSLNEFPGLQSWFNRVRRRPAVQKGVNVPKPFTARQMEDLLG
jgi:hypothetical protein